MNRTRFALLLTCIPFALARRGRTLLNKGNHATVYNDLHFPVGLWATGDPTFDSGSQPPPYVLTKHRHYVLRL